MDRTPATTSAEPRCFGVSYHADDGDCRRCPARERCEPLCRFWTDRRSISQVEADITHFVDDSEGIDPEIMLREIVREHIGRPHRYRSKDDKRKIVLGLAAVRADLRARKPAQSLTVWIEAQVGCLKDRIASNGVILPGHMLGPEAERRYRGHVRYLNRNFVNETLRVRRDYSVQLDDVSYELFELLRLCWLDATSPREHPAYGGLSAQAIYAFTHPDSARGRACALRAACDFLHHLKPGLQHRIACPPSWDWTAFMRFVLDHFPPAEAATSPTPELGGVSFAH